jgi:1,4-dihydroxy-2-naphthoate octaprenyltransferase
VKGADTAARVGPRRAVAAGLISPAAMHRAMWAVFAAAFLCGLGLITWGGPWLILIGALSTLCGLAYTGGPWPLGYHGLGDVFVFVFFGLVAVGATYFVQAGSLEADAIVTGVGVGLLTANILVVNNYRDVETDTVAGKRTLVVRFGRGFARGQFAVSLGVAVAVIPAWLAWRDHNVWHLLPLVLAPLAWRHMSRLAGETQPAQQIKLLGDTGKLLAFYAILLTAGLVL